MSDGKLNILIIGAGVAGLAAARHMVSSRSGERYNITILEARDRIGGRIWTNTAVFPGASGCEVDFGAGWIHGSCRQNPITYVAESFNIYRQETDYGSRVVFHNGRTLSNEAVEKVEDLVEKITDKISTMDDVRPDVSVFATLQKLGYSKQLNEPLFNSIISAEIESDYAATIDQIGTDLFGDDDEFEGHDEVLPNGFTQVVECLRKGAEGEPPLNVLLNQPVRRITHDAKHVVVETDYDRFDADRVIITVPLGTLKDRSIIFEPPLSVEKENAITAIGFGLLNKLILRFDRVFWKEDTFVFVHVPNDIEQRGFLTYWINLYAATGKPTLIGFLAGNSAEQAEAADVADVMEGGMAILRSMFGPNIPNPVAYARTMWRSEPFTRGSYSFNQVGASRDDWAALEDSEGTLHFAGEHTNFDYHGTVHGAYLSGVRAAKEIEESFEDQTESSDDD